MQVALVNTTKKSKLYPLPLMKISSMLKKKGHTVKLSTNKLPKKNEYDEIWMTTLFTFELDHALTMAIEAKNRAKVVKVGGVSASLLPKYFKKYGINPHVGMHSEIEKHIPDYSILGENPEYSITHTSRGCIRDCGFCMVPKLEPKYTVRNWIDDINLKAKKILFYDNNWTAKPFKEKVKDVEKMQSLVDKGINCIDFNQGMDARIMTDKIADLLKGLPIKPVRFAFDGMHEDGHWQRAVEIMIKRGFRDFMTYTLYNFEDTPEDFYYRLKEQVRMSERYNINCNAFPMKYKPIMNIDSKNYVGKYWSKKMITGFATVQNRKCIGGQVSFNNINELEYWLGKNDNDFLKIMSYDKIVKLCESKANKESFCKY